ncbi:phosphotriesterase-related protein [Alicyclobacillus cycloheptanicus]|uniref:Phosphotriesterase-related protein n=1 Tax=Alicyclobacillus cycloheptanicus TaxID=1457 RepID=A0ABT9XF47_9BACL|nr:phosphotriesterase-related protein [Alicyclobacillus cycloheptanicus]MDQ0188922.1 phosphotriesterase-related protein [Alicyclobacillus cycloheptanicus]WDM01729.1 phosphotriesterase-related protein [Alicyclobacillus cycloheptanicus]
MTIINTVKGQIDSSQLGCTLIHEHLRSRSESVAFQFPHLYDEAYEYQKALEQVLAVEQRGVQTICDPTVMEIGRDIRFMERVANATSVQIIAATGIYTYHYVPPHFQNRSIDYMAEVFVRDIEVGIQNTSIKAGFLKCATDAQGITPDVEKVIRAVARAHKKTGVPIMTHSHPASGTGLKQLDIFDEEGVNPKKVLISHCGDTDSLDYLLQVAERGAFMGMDRYGIGRPLALPTERRNDTVIQLVKRGYANQMFLSQDYCCTIDWFPEEVTRQMLPKWSMTYVLDEIIPQLIEGGVSEAQIKTMLYDNARRWFEGSGD